MKIMYMQFIKVLLWESFGRPSLTCNGLQKFVHSGSERLHNRLTLNSAGSLLALFYILTNHIKSPVTMALS